MNLFGRRVKAGAIPAKVIELLGMLVRSFRFRHVASLWSSYIKRQPPQSNACELRSGARIFLSSNPHDIITVMVNFCRSEYGVIEPGWVVVDIGANIGAFTVLAVESGASRVIAFEPNQEAFETLRKNVEENGLIESVEFHHRAVCDVSDKTLFIPNQSSPYNKTSDKPGSRTMSEVKTIALQHALSDCDRVDLMKLDCEGAEYQIILESDREAFSRVKRIRMELHPSREFTRAQVVEHLESIGFDLVRRVGLIFWFERPHEA